MTAGRDMDEHGRIIGDLLARVRARRRRLVAWRAVTRGALAVSGVLAAAFLLTTRAIASTGPLVLTGGLALTASVAAAIWAAWPVRKAPSDAQVARFIEEHEASLEERLVSAVDLLARPSAPDGVARALLADAARAAARVETDAVVSGLDVRRAQRAAVAAVGLLVAVGFAGRHAARRTVEAAAHLFLPAPTSVRVEPGAAPARVVRPPRVTRIDVEYLSSATPGGPSRLDADGGDIYAPAGSRVRLHVKVDRPATGQLRLDRGEAIDLSADPEATAMTGALTVTRDGSYRVALVDREGVSNSGETEYFIRTAPDRPPEVRVLKPARDRSVTSLEEVEIEAEADDDVGIDRLDLVYAVVGGADRVVRLPVPRGAATVTGRHLLYLEDLDVRPGDVVSYYVRARDVGRGRRGVEARSDIFFLEVRPFDQEFSAADSQASGTGSGSRSLDDLVVAQKDIVVATWKLDRRRVMTGATSEPDVRAVGRAEAELRTRVVRTASAFRESMMRNPRGPRPTQPGGRGGAAPPDEPPRAGRTVPEEDAMAAAAAALGRAVSALEALQTPAALPSEMEALHHLLQAQAEVRKRQVTRSQPGAQSASNRSNEDLSSLFDRELQRQQQTHYETPARPDPQGDGGDGAIDKIRELARRQDEVARRQEALARQRDSLPPEVRARELETLTREQLALLEQAQTLARDLAGTPGAAEATGTPGKKTGSAPGSPRGADLRAVAGEMRGAVNDLQRRDPARASARGDEALRRLREIEAGLGRGEAAGRGAAPEDAAARRLADQRTRARRLRERIDQLAADLQRAGQAPGRSRADGMSQPPLPGARGTEAGGARAGEGIGERNLSALREEYIRQLKEAQALLAELSREDASAPAGQPGFTFEGQGTILSAPGTEAFKQDLAKWEQLRKQATMALDAAGSTLARKLQAKAVRDRMASGDDDRPPAGYEAAVDAYFQSLAARQKR